MKCLKCPSVTRVLLLECSFTSTALLLAATAFQEPSLLNSTERSRLFHPQNKTTNKQKRVRDVAIGVEETWGTPWTPLKRAGTFKGDQPPTPKPRFPSVYTLAAYTQLYPCDVQSPSP